MKLSKNPYYFQINALNKRHHSFFFTFNNCYLNGSLAFLEYRETAKVVPSIFVFNDVKY